MKIEETGSAYCLLLFGCMFISCWSCISQIETGHHIIQFKHFPSVRWCSCCRSIKDHLLHASKPLTLKSAAVSFSKLGVDFTSAQVVRHIYSSRSRRWCCVLFPYCHCLWGIHPPILVFGAHILLLVPIPRKCSKGLKGKLICGTKLFTSKVARQ